MASAGKKGKKNKGTVISLQSFLSNGDAPAGTTQVSKKIRNIDGDDSDDGGNSLPLVYQLPTAPRANRIFDDDSIPHKGPFIAYVTNLPFDVNDDDIYDFFGNTQIVSLRLPREDGETGRVRGFGYVELESREDLIDMLSLPDPCIKGRRIRIELSNENEQQNNRQRGGRRGYDGFGNSNENRDSTNWRRDNENSGGAPASGGYGSNYDRGSGGGGDRDRGGFNRDRRDRERTNDDNDTPGSWRMGARRVSPQGDRNTDNGGYRDRGNTRNNYDREDRGGYGRRDKEVSSEPAAERPKLNLKPRTLPLPEIVTIEEPEEPKPADEESIEPSQQPLKPSGISAEKVFGSAKPVDTAAREQEIEERLEEIRRQEKLRREQEVDEIQEKVGDIQLEKTQKETANTAISWRNRTEPQTSSDDKGDRYKNRDNRPDSRSDPQKPKREDNKTRRDVKTDRPLPQYQPNTSGPVLQTANKYSGLDDEVSD